MMQRLSNMVWDVELRSQRREAMATLASLGFCVGIPPRRLGDRFTFSVSNVPSSRRREVEATVLSVAADATLREQAVAPAPAGRLGARTLHPAGRGEVSVRPVRVPPAPASFADEPVMHAASVEA